MLVRPQCQTSVTKSGTDGGPELAGVQGTEWHSTTGPDGPMRSLPFFACEKKKNSKSKRNDKNYNDFIQGRRKTCRRN